MEKLESTVYIVQEGTTSSAKDGLVSETKKGMKMQRVHMRTRGKQTRLVTRASARGMVELVKRVGQWVPVEIQHTVKRVEDEQDVVCRTYTR